jgi:4'-phosphopantetheinyl transferase EntD
MVVSLLDETNLAIVLSKFTNAEVIVAAGGFVADNSPFLQEAQLVANAVASRRREFFSGRFHARRALARIHDSAPPILRGEKGNPLWPAGVIGSITHDLDKVVVAVMAESTLGGLGIDLVLDPARIEPNLQPLIARSTELTTLSVFFKDTPSLALAFSLKESVVKAVSPGIDRYLDLMDIELNVAEGKIVAYLAEFNVHLECGFLALENGLLSFASLQKQ